MARTGDAHEVKHPEPRVGVLQHAALSHSMLPHWISTLTVTPWYFFRGTDGIGDPEGLVVHSWINFAACFVASGVQ